MQAGTCLYGQGGVAVVVRSDGGPTQYYSPLVSRIVLADVTVEDGPPSGFGGRFPFTLFLPRNAYIFGRTGDDWIIDHVDSSSASEVRATLRRTDAADYTATINVALPWGSITTFQTRHQRSRITDFETDQLSDEDEATLQRAADLEPVERGTRIPVGDIDYFPDHRSRQKRLTRLSVTFHELKSTCVRRVGDDAHVSPVTPVEHVDAHRHRLLNGVRLGEDEDVAGPGECLAHVHLPAHGALDKLARNRLGEAVHLVPVSGHELAHWHRSARLAKLLEFGCQLLVRAQLGPFVTASCQKWHQQDQPRQQE
jgi:hypothetical protein